MRWAALRWTRLIPLALLGASLLPGVPLPSVAGPPSAQAQSHPVGGKRLILKDGSYQIVTKYQIIGNRVRYLSAERDDWEEVPYSLVNWPATLQWNKEHALGAKPSSSGQAPLNKGEQEAAAIDKAAAAARLQQQQQQPTVAPGLQLPNLNGVWVLDTFQNVPELLQLHQSTGNVNQGGTHSILRAAIASFRGADVPIRLNGQSARVRLHVDDPAIYVSLTNPGEQVEAEPAMIVNVPGNDSAPDRNDVSSPKSRYVIVRVEVQPGQRIVGALRLRRVGIAAQSESIVPTKELVLPGGFWMKLIPEKPLTIGQYALMEILGPGQVNLDVWDFAISPSSPENKHPLTPIQPTQ